MFFRSEDVSVRYAVVFNGYTELGDDAEVYVEPGSDAGENPNGPKLKQIVAKALRQETSLPLDIQSLTFEAGKHLAYLDLYCHYYMQFFR